jgi:hypothetical protein
VASHVFRPGRTVFTPRREDRLWSDELRERMRLRFAEPDLHAQLVSRMVMGHVVVDLEHITRNFPDGKGVVAMVCVYEVVDGLIVKASFAMGTPSLKG